MKINTISSYNERYSSNLLRNSQAQNQVADNRVNQENVSFGGLKKIRATAGILAALQAFTISAALTKNVKAADIAPTPTTAVVQTINTNPAPYGEESTYQDEEDKKLIQFVYDKFIPQSNLITEDDDMMVQRLKHEANINILTNRAKELREGKVVDNNLLSAVNAVINDSQSRIAALDEIDRQMRTGFATEVEPPSPTPTAPALPPLLVVDTFEDIYGYNDSVFARLQEIIPEENIILVSDSDKVKADKKAKNDEIVRAEAERLLKEAEDTRKQGDEQYDQAVKDWHRYYETGEGDIKEIENRLNNSAFVQAQVRRSSGIGSNLLAIAESKGYGAYMLLEFMNPIDRPSNSDVPTPTPAFGVDNRTPEEKAKERELTQNYIYGILPKRNLIKPNENIDSIINKKIKNDGILFREAEKLEEEAKILKEEGEKEFVECKRSLFFTYKKQDGTEEEMEVRIFELAAKLTEADAKKNMAKNLREIANSDSWGYYMGNQK